TSSIATSVWGAMQYQITKALFSIVVRTMPHIPFFKGINSKVSAAALRHHIKAALNKSASVQDFKIQLNHLVQRQDFDNATKALIREIEGGMPPDEPPPGGGGGGGIANPRLGDSGGKSPSTESSPSSVGGKEGDGGNKPPKGDDEHTGKEGNGSGDGAGGNPPSSDDLLDPSKPLRRARPEEITQELLERVKETNAKIWVGDLTNPQILEHLGLEPDRPVKMLFDGNALKHIEKRHGLNAPLVKSSGQPAITREDIATYPQIINNADLMRIEDTKDHQKALVIGKQVNGYFIAVEIISQKNNTLKLKTMYKGNGKLEMDSIFKDGAQIRLSKDSVAP
ncbi:PBECR3 domain-containing polyvalent protein, partial [Helicobacter bizzozeronii]